MRLCHTAKTELAKLFEKKDCGNDGDTKHAWDLAVSRLACGIVCISWSAIFVRWTDMPGAGFGVLPLANSHGGDAAHAVFRPQSARRVKTLLIIAAGGIFFALDLAFYNTSF